MSDLPGLDLARFASWFGEAQPGQIDGPLSGQLLVGGRSNLTYRVSDGRRRWIVRRPPLAHVLATAHDMAREYRVITALRDTAVPVPRTYALCRDEGVIGAPFYVMEMVDGTPYRHAAELSALGPGRTAAIAFGMVDALAALHEVDPAAVGLGDFGRPEGFLARQVRRWRTQLDASRSRELPATDELYRRLAELTPAEAPSGIVHGDYRLDNVLIDDTDRLTAVVDWEMATLGDPLTDVALMVVYQRLARLAEGFPVADAAAAPGYPSESQMLARYAAASSRTIGDLGFYLGLASFKLAVVLEGIHLRYLGGQTVGDGFERVGEVVEPIAAAGLRSIEEHR